jgi:hypothetical protein
MICTIVLTSLPLVRRKAFELFKYTHYVFAVFLAFGYLHTPSKFLPYLIAAVVVYGLDRLIRFAWALPRRTKAIDVSHKGLVKLAFQKNSAAVYLRRYDLGQFVSHNTCS